MKLGKAGQMLGIDPKTLRNWIDNKALRPYFSPDATGDGAGIQREISDNDLFVLNTVRVLRAGQPNNDPHWADIADALKGGRRDRELPPQAAALDTGLSMISQVGVAKERDMALARISELENALKVERNDRLNDQQQHTADQERLLRELADQRERLGRADVELELWRSGRIKPELE